MRTLLLLLLLPLASAAQQPVEETLRDIETVRSRQDDVLAELESILREHRSGAADSDLLYALGAIIRIEERVLESVRETGRKSLGKTPDQLPQELRDERERILQEQERVTARFEEWWARMSPRLEDKTRTDLARIGDQIREAKPRETLGTILEDLRGNRLPGAARNLQKVISDLKGTLELLQTAFGNMHDAARRVVEMLSRIIEQESDLLASTLAVGSATGTASPAELSVRQSQIRRQSESLADTMEGSTPGAAPPVRACLPLMELASLSLGRGEIPVAVELEQEVLKYLNLALDLVREMLAEEGEEAGEGMAIFFRNAKLHIRSRQQAIRAMLAGAGAGQNPMAEVMNDLTAIRDLMKAQVDLRRRTGPGTAENPETLGAMALEQSEMSLTSTALSQRTLHYEIVASRALADAGGRMKTASEGLRGAEIPAAAAAQDQALASLRASEQAVQEFWDALLEAMANLMQQAEGSMAMGGASTGKALKPEDRRLLLIRLRAVVRMNEISKAQAVLIQQVESILAGETEGDPETLGSAQEGLAERILGVAKDMDEADPHLAGQLYGVWDRMIGARIMLAIARYDGALPMQRGAQEWIRITVKESSGSMGQLAASKSLQADPLDSGNRSEDVSGMGLSSGVEARAWLWSLPEREREKVERSLAEPFPAEYDPLIRGYFERLAGENQESRIEN